MRSEYSENFEISNLFISGYIDTFSCIILPLLFFNHFFFQFKKDEKDNDLSIPSRPISIQPDQSRVNSCPYLQSIYIITEKETKQFQCSKLSNNFLVSIKSQINSATGSRERERERSNCVETRNSWQEKCIQPSTNRLSYK